LRPAIAAQEKKVGRDRGFGLIDELYCVPVTTSRPFSSTALTALWCGRCSYRS